MAAFDELVQDVVINNISFAEHAVEINYLETRHQLDSLGKVQSIVFDENANATINNYVAEIKSICEDLVEELEVILRNPPDSFSLNPRERVKSRRHASTEAEDENE